MSGVKVNLGSGKRKRKGKKSLAAGSFPADFARLFGALGGRGGEPPIRPTKKRAAKVAPEPAKKRPAKGSAKPEKKRPAKGPAKPEKKRPAKGSAKPEKKRPAKGPAKPEKKRPAKGPAKPEKKRPAKGPAKPEKKRPAKGPAKPEKKRPAKVPAKPEKKRPAKVPPKPAKKRPAKVPPKPAKKRAAKGPAKPQKKRPAKVPPERAKKRAAKVPSKRAKTRAEERKEAARSARARERAELREKRQRLLDKQPGQSIAERCRVMREVARDQGVLPPQTRSTDRAVHTPYKKGRVIRLVFGVMLTEQSLESILYRLSHYLKKKPASAFYLLVWEFLIYGNRRLAGGSSEMLESVWWAPDAGEAHVERVSTGEQTSLSMLLYVARTILENSLPYSSEGVLVEAAIISQWDHRTPKEKSRWIKRHKQHKQPRSRPQQRAKQSKPPKQRPRSRPQFLHPHKPSRRR
jgi:hypothetical protein